MLEELRASLAPFYLQVKTVHLLAVGLWSFSTAVAYRDYVVPAFITWRRNPADPVLIARRDYAMERFDRGAQLEHWAFPLVLLTGVAMVWMAGWSMRELNWLTAKSGLVLLVFIPMEALDYYLSHFGGNKARIRASGDMCRYESMIGIHWTFFRVTTPLVLTLIPLAYYLAVTKPF